MKPLLIVILLSVSGAVFADTLRVNPGLWETKMTRTNPMGGDPVTDTTESCVDIDTYDPKTVMVNIEGCKVLNNTVTGNTVDFALQCDAPTGAVNASGKYEATSAEAGAGNMTVKMSMGPVKMDMSMNWTSHRIGDC
jgi:hypothetical protein